MKRNMRKGTIEGYSTKKNKGAQLYNDNRQFIKTVINLCASN